MPDNANVLRFRTRSVTGDFPRGTAAAHAKAYLEATPECRSTESLELLANADVLLSLCSLLRDQVNTAPLQIAEEASRLHTWVAERLPVLGFFDERDFFLGETALIAGSALRLLGRRDETERWLDRADAGFRHTLNAVPNLARVAYARLTLRYDMLRHDDVLELLPSVALTFKKLGMDQELAKCRFLEAMALKDLGRNTDAMARLEDLVAGAEVRCDEALCGMALVNLGDLQGQDNRFDLALKSYSEALPLLQSSKRYVALADLKGMVGDTLQRMGRVEPSIVAYREAIQDFSTLGVVTSTAYLRVVLAGALLEAGRVSEAEWEIRAALPTIANEKMVPEGFEAMKVLREALLQRKTDPKALLELREYLQAKN